MKTFVKMVFIFGPPALLETYIHSETIGFIVFIIFAFIWEYFDSQIQSKIRSAAVDELDRGSQQTVQSSQSKL